MTQGIQFTGAYPLEVRYHGGQTWRAQRDIVAHAIREKQAQGKKVEVLQFYRNASDKHPFQAEPFLGTIDDRDFYWESKIRLAEWDDSSSEEQLVWLEDDAAGDDATQVKTLWTRALADAKQQYGALNLIEKLKRHYEEGVVFAEFAPLERFYRIPLSIRENLSKGLLELFAKAGSSPTLSLTREDRIHWASGGQPVNTTVMKHDRR